MFATTFERSSRLAHGFSDFDAFGGKYLGLLERSDGINIESHRLTQGGTRLICHNEPQGIWSWNRGNTGDCLCIVATQCQRAAGSSGDHAPLEGEKGNGVDWRAEAGVNHG